ncbi:putative PB1 domain-containing protein [Helianthus annuus]|nr:putative PB1 domain-containing protein [Helianthus annuus]
MNQMSSTKVRLMCSNGGHIVPRPHDKTLCYVGGETRMLVVDRHTTLLNLTHRLSNTLLRSSSPFTIKYQLPSEDLDSLISLTTDEDLQHMIEEYDRLNSSSSSSRLRLFIFPTDPESVLLTGSGLDSLLKSEDWFVNVLNGGANLGVSDTSSFNCLLNLDDEVYVPEKKDVNDGKTNGSGQDVHSVPDSLMIETTSSFGSESSSPSLVNLPPIRVNADGHQKVIGGVEEQFSQMSVEQRDIKHQNDEGLVASPAPVVVSGSPVSSMPAIQEQSEQGLQVAYLKCHHQQYLSDLTSNYDRAVDPNGTIDQTVGIQLQPQTQNPACLLSMPTTQTDSPRNQLHHQQQQLIPPQQHIYHHPSGAVPMASYYHHQPHQLPMDQQNFVYYIPARQLPQGYNFPLQQPQSSYDAPPVVATIPPGNQTVLKTDSSTGVYRTTSSVASQPVRTPYVGYSEIHQPSQLLYYATQAMPSLSAAHYKNMASISPFEASLQEQVRTALP